MILSAALGITLSNAKKREMKIYSQFYEFNEKLILNLKYGREKVSVIAGEFEFVNKLLGGEKLVDGDGEQFLENYLSNIGGTDAMSQIDYLNERKQELSKYKQISEDNYKKYGSLYLKICLLGGILIAVLLA